MGLSASSCEINPKERQVYASMFQTLWFTSIFRNNFNFRKTSRRNPESINANSADWRIMIQISMAKLWDKIEWTKSNETTKG